MKKSVVLQAAFLPALLSLSITPSTELSNSEQVEIYKIKKALSCVVDRAELANKFDDDVEIPLMPGSGSYTWNIGTTNDSAQFYFNQGINTYYGFHIIESLASFKKAARFDPENPMIWWGQALAYGPNINDVEYNASPDAVAAVTKAMSLSQKASARDKDLITAMTVRYSEDTTKKREELNQAYTDAMKKVYEKHPGSSDVLALYADAMMLQHPWELWNIDSTAKPWTPHIQEVLEKGLAVAPEHPGLNHYYIHVIEPSPTPEKAKASADRLGALTPGLAHLVHMPSHIYLRIGEFNRGTEINQKAVSRFREYSQLFPAVADGAFIYYLHNQHMLVNCAMHAGRYKIAIDAALELQQSIDSATLALQAPMGSLMQYIHMAPVLINVRFEKWDSLLHMEQPAPQFIYANILYNFGLGMANAARNDLAKAKKNSEQIAELLKNEDLKIPLSPFSSAFEGALTASELLKGMIALKERKFDAAISHLVTSVETEKQMVYNEPRDWFLNPHQYLGMAYMASKEYAKAEKAFLEDLGKNANNVWSLNRLSQAQKLQKKTKQAEATKKAFAEATAESDVNWILMKY